MKKFKWTEKQKRALRGSIKKWENIVDGTGIDEGANNCPCCKIWDQNHECHGCPISSFTGEENCLDTPYYNDNCGEQFHADSKAELKFLRKVYKAGGGT